MNRATPSPLSERAGLRLSIALLSVALGAPLSAGFLSTDTFLPAVGRVPGQNGAQFYTTVWATNLTSATVNFTFDFLRQGQANLTPASFTDTLAAGETKVYENVVESKLGLTDSLGAARVTSTGEILVAERIYNQAPGDDLGKTEGLFFAGVPKAFSISLGQSASIQGINQGGSENFRYNFALVETGGVTTTVHVVLADAAGALLGQKDYLLLPYEQLQPNAKDLFAGIATTNARITATVTAGGGSVLLAGAQLTNESEDSSGFEMSFRDELLGGGSGGLAAVVHDGTLVGNGTVSTPLGVNPAAVVTSLNALHGAVTLSAGTNVTLTPSGQTLTIAASGGGGGLTLPFSGSANVASTVAVFTVTNTSATPGLGLGIRGSGGTTGVEGDGVSGGLGVVGSGGIGVQGIAAPSSGIGVDGESAKIGVHGGIVPGPSASGKAGVEGTAQSDPGVLGESVSGSGVEGQSNSSWGLHGVSSGTGINGAAVYAQGTGIGLFATNNSSVDSAIVATNASSGGDVYKGFGGGGTLVFEVTSQGDVYAHGTFHPTGIDYADRLRARDGLEPGDVVAIGEDGILRKTERPNDPSVAGVYSTRPGVEGQDERHAGGRTIPVALAGVIPVRATVENGPIAPGDLLVSSSNPGCAMRAPDAPAPGTVVGKAMEGLRSGDGTIEMLVMLR